MSEAPERINVVVTEAEVIGPFPPEDTRATEYVRGDHSAALVAAAYQDRNEVTCEKCGTKKSEHNRRHPFVPSRLPNPPADAQAALNALIQKAVEAERESCAQVAELLGDIGLTAAHKEYEDGHADACGRIAAAIREGKA